MRALGEACIGVFSQVEKIGRSLARGRFIVTTAAIVMRWRLAFDWEYHHSISSYVDGEGSVAGSKLRWKSR
jgi:hypothetical protein